MQRIQTNCGWKRLKTSRRTLYSSLSVVSISAEAYLLVEASNSIVALKVLGGGVRETSKEVCVHVRDH